MQQDMRAAITPKSDQINYEDFLGGKTMTVKITNVTIKSGEQPVTVSFEGDNGKPYKPCKSMCKVMVIVWGADANKYIGRSMTLYGDPSITWGGMAVGGIRISHMSHIDAPVTMALAATRANKKLFTVKPLVVQPEQTKQPEAEQAPPSALSDAQKHLLMELDEYCLATGLFPADVLKEVSYWSKKRPDGTIEKEGSLAIADVEKPNSNEKFQKFVGTTLGRLRERAKEKGAAE